jgi:ABC-type proline/glycine betaine transport system permease subunit
MIKLTYAKVTAVAASLVTASTAVGSAARQAWVIVERPAEHS